MRIPTVLSMGAVHIRWLDEVARKAEESDVEYLQQVGRLLQAVVR